MDNKATTSAKLTLPNGKEIQFTPSGKGLASFVITVKDSDGDSMSRTINFFVK